jgi:hypothetical protein
MKRILAIVTVGLTLAFAFAFRLADEKGTQVLRQLGVSEEDAKDYVWLDFSHAIFSYPRTEQMLALAKGDRPATVEAIVGFARTYTKSKEFIERYQTYRNGKKPEPPEPPKSMAELRKEQREQLQKSLKEIEDNLKSASPEQREQYKPVLDGLRESIKSIDDPDNPMYSKDVENAYRQAYEGQLETFRKDSLDWEREWTVDPDSMLVRGLEKFLEVSAEVDFSAAVVRDKSGYTTFANPEYESKPPEWKFCYRAGRETVKAARTAAKDWLKELKSGK